VKVNEGVIGRYGYTQLPTSLLNKLVHPTLPIESAVKKEMEPGIGTRGWSYRWENWDEQTEQARCKRGTKFRH